MKRRTSLLASLALLSLASSAQAQTAQRIIELHIKALGGSKALKSVTSVRLRGTLNGSGEFLWQAKAPSAYYLELRHGGRHAAFAFNGKSAWGEDEAAGARTLTGEEQARARAEGVYRNDHFLGHKKDKTRINLLGRETVDGRAAHAIAVTGASGIRRKVFFDAQTYLILKEEQERPGGTVEIHFSDYRALDGVQQPQRIRIRRGGETLELVVQEVAHNASLDLALFDFPRRDGSPLPDVAVLFKQVMESQRELEKAKEDYAYIKAETDIEINDQGRIKEKSERTYEGFYLLGKEIEKLVARNGQPLEDDEARKEQQRIEKQAREHRERMRKDAEQKATQDPKQAEKDREGVQLTISQILRVCQLVNPRRERFRGREVVVFDFEPRPGEKPRGRAESWMQKLSGNIWIDEHAKAIVRAEARVNEAIKMGVGSCCRSSAARRSCSSRSS